MTNRTIHAGIIGYGPNGPGKIGVEIYNKLHWRKKWDIEFVTQNQKSYMVVECARGNKLFHVHPYNAFASIDLLFVVSLPPEGSLISDLVEKSIEQGKILIFCDRQAAGHYALKFNNYYRNFGKKACLEYKNGLNAKKTAEIMIKDAKDLLNI